jgi:hypothetical protein
VQLLGQKLVGLPEKGRERMLVWGEELFNRFGPMNDRTIASFGVPEEMMDCAANEAVPEKLKLGSWAHGIHDAVARTKVPAQVCPAMMVDYMGPSLDTTIPAISNASGCSPTIPTSGTQKEHINDYLIQ